MTKNIENKFNEGVIEKIRKLRKAYIIGAIALMAGLGIAGYCENKSAVKSGLLLSVTGCGTMGYALYSKCRYDKTR